MIKTNNKKEYLFMRGINLKYNKYYTSNIRLHTKKAILEAYRLGLKITKIDTLMDEGIKHRVQLKLTKSGEWILWSKPKVERK